MTLHAGTREREILDRLLTDSRFKSWHREILEEVIFEIVAPLNVEIDELQQEVDNLIDVRDELKEELSELKERYSAIRSLILDPI